MQGFYNLWPGRRGCIPQVQIIPIRHPTQATVLSLVFRSRFLLFRLDIGIALKGLVNIAFSIWLRSPCAGENDAINTWIITKPVNPTTFSIFCAPPLPPPSLHASCLFPIGFLEQTTRSKSIWKTKKWRRASRHCWLFYLGPFLTRASAPLLWKWLAATGDTSGCEIGSNISSVRKVMVFQS